MIVRMWEVKARSDALTELLTWVCDTAIPGIEVNPLHISSEVFSSADGRVVVISRWRSNVVELAQPARRLIERSPHSWDFSPVDR
jgi:hypothetical protein